MKFRLLDSSHPRRTPHVREPIGTYFLAVGVKERHPNWSIGIQTKFSQEFLHCVEAHTRANAVHAAANFLSSLRWKFLSFLEDKTLSMPGQLLLPVAMSFSSTSVLPVEFHHIRIRFTALIDKFKSGAISGCVLLVCKFNAITRS